MSGFLNWWMVALGAAIGGCARYGVNLALAAFTGPFPWATFAVNAVGGGLMGFVFASADLGQWRGQPLFLFWTTGFMGGLTTFSAFTAESARLIQNDQWGTALFHALGHVVAALVMFFLGVAAARCLKGL